MDPIHTGRVPSRSPTLLQDHLGGTNQVINSSGAATQMRYVVWGAARDTLSNLPTSRLYTGQEKSNTGLYYYNARWYDSDLGRFVQPDMIIPDPYNPLDLDRFTYTRNNPIMNNDPSGHCIGPLAIACVALVVAAIGAIWMTGDTPRQELIDNPELTQQDFEGALYATGVVITVGESLTIANSFIASTSPTKINPELEIDLDLMPNIASNIKDAQNKGAPSILTRTTDPGRIKGKQKCGLYWILWVWELPDEYPFASTYEGGAGAFVKGVPINEQRIQGGVIYNFYQRYNIGDGDKFRVIAK